MAEPPKKSKKKSASSFVKTYKICPQCKGTGLYMKRWAPTGTLFEEYCNCGDDRMVFDKYVPTGDITSL